VAIAYRSQSLTPSCLGPFPIVTSTSVPKTKLELLYQLSEIWNHKQAPSGMSLMLKPLSSDLFYNELFVKNYKKIGVSSKLWNSEVLILAVVR